MVIHMENLTPLGQLLEAARGSTSKRAAARAAGISEGRWRQIVTGVQKVGGGVEVQANPKRETVIAMARAVGVGDNVALAAAGYEPTEIGRPYLTTTEDPVEAAIEADPQLPTRQQKDAALAVVRSLRGQGGGAPRVTDGTDVAVRHQ